MDTGIVQTAETSIVALYHKHLLQIIGVGVFVIALFIGAFAYVVHSANVRDAAADQKTSAFMVQLKQEQEDSLAAIKRVASDTTQQQAIIKVVQVRDQQAQTITQTVTKPDNTVQQVANDSSTYLKVTPTITTDNTLAYQKADVQQFIATKIDNDRVTLNLADTQTQLSLEQDKFNTVSTQLEVSQKSTDTCKVALDSQIAARKADARKGRFKIVIGFISGYAAGVATGRFLP